MNQPLENWKSNLNESGLFTQEQVWELEDHLQTRIDELLARGHEAKDAARIATLEIGDLINETMLSQYQESCYLDKLKQSGVFTKGDLLEIEDHFYCTYALEIEKGANPIQALRRTEQQIGKTEQIIEKYKHKNRHVYWGDYLGFAVFGAVFQNLTLVSLTRAACNFSIFLAYLIDGNNPEHWISYAILSPFLLIAIGYPILFVKNQRKVFDFLIRNRVWGILALGLLISPVLLEGLSFSLIKYGQRYFPNLVDIWSQSSMLSELLNLWSLFLVIANLFWLIFFACLFMKNRATTYLSSWNSRWMIFYLAGFIGSLCLALMFNAQLSLFDGIVRIFFVSMVLIACCCFPFYYRKFFWKKAYLA